MYVLLGELIDVDIKGLYLLKSMYVMAFSLPEYGRRELSMDYESYLQMQSTAKGIEIIGLTAHQNTSIPSRSMKTPSSHELGKLHRYGRQKRTKLTIVLSNSAKTPSLC